MTRDDVHDPVCDEPTDQQPQPFNPGPRAEVLPAREVPLGGLRAITVNRSLPQRNVPTIGAWCFLDRFGPEPSKMRVEPHPHVGLQTVTWPLVGEIHHRDSIGSDVVLVPGALNLMTSGHGIAHSEYTVTDDAIALDGLQLWIALPEHARHGERKFETHTDLPRVALPTGTGADAMAMVVMGTFAGITSPATTFTPLVGAQIDVPAGARVTLPLEHAWEHGIMMIHGDVTVANEQGEAFPIAAPNEVLYIGNERSEVTVSSIAGARIFVLGGEPFADDLVMWWNFVGRSHEEIVQAREDWEARSERFGHVVGHDDTRIPAPPMPPLRLTPRRRK